MKSYVQAQTIERLPFRAPSGSFQRAMRLPEPQALAERTQSTPSLDRALTILELLADSKTGLTLPELVSRTGLPKSSVHCLLVTLQRRHYLYRHERTSRYKLGLKLFSLGNMALTGNELRERAAPFLRALTEKTGLTSHLAILEHQEAVVVAKFEPLRQMSQLATWLGKRMDVHCTSLGKALIAYLPEADIERIVSEHGLPRHNENSLCSRRKLKEDLDRVVQRGYAIDDEEDELGLRCIGAPILTGQGLALASISISGTIAQIPSNLSTLAALVMGTARSIEKSAAYSSSELF